MKRITGIILALIMMVTGFLTGTVLADDADDWSIAWSSYLPNKDTSDISVIGYADVTQISDGVVAVGYSYNVYHWTEEAVIVKYDDSGNIIWSSGESRTGVDRYNAVTAVPNGVVAVGYSDSRSFNTGIWNGETAKGITDAVIVKYNENGAIEWQAHYGESDYHHGFLGVTAVPDGVVAVGDCFRFVDIDGIFYDAKIVKYDVYGEVVWSRNYSEEDALAYYGAITAVPDGVVAVGHSYSLLDDGIESFIVKYDDDGYIEWKHNVTGILNDVKAVPDGVVAVGALNDDAIVIKYDNDGEIMWQKILSKVVYEYSGYMGVTVVPDGFFAVGYGGAFTNDDLDYINGAVVVRYDSNGDVMWKRSVSVTGPANGTAIGRGGYYAVTAVSDGIVAVGADVNYAIIAKYSASVPPQPTLTISAPMVTARPGSEVAFDISVTNNPGIKSIAFDMAYDSDKLEFISLEAETGTPITYDNKNGTVGVSWLTNGVSTLLEADGKLFTAVFKVKDTFRQGESPLGLSGYATNMTVRLDTVFVDGSVLVYRLGKIVGDGEIDMLDAINIQSIWLDILVFSPEGERVPPTPAQLLAADINGDGRVDANDLILILRYIAGDPGIIL